MDTTFLTFVATNTLDGLTGQSIERALRMLAPDWVETVELAAAQGQDPNIVRINGLPLALMIIPRPLPSDAWSEAARRSVIFKDAPEAMQRTSAHVIVASLAKAPDHRAALNTAKAVTLAAAAVAMVTEAEAVVFTWGQVILQARTVVEGARAVGRGELPVLFWTTLQFFRGTPAADGEESLGAVTTGMLPFIGREVEFAPSRTGAPKLGERVLNLCHYLLMQGPVVRHGETVGQTPEEKFRVTERDQGERPGIPVLHFACEADTPPPAPPAPEPIPLVQPITPGARFAAMPAQGERVFGKRRWPAA